MKAMNAVERQRRRRNRLRAERKAAKRDKVGSSLDPKLPPAERADKVALKIAITLRENPDLSIDDIRAAIDRRWPRPSTANQSRAEGKVSEMSKPAVSKSEDEKIRQDADAYRLEQARAILRALGS